MRKMLTRSGFMRVSWLRLLVAVVATCALVYAGDEIVLKIRESKGSAQGSMVVNNSYVVHQKSGKLEYLFDPPQTMPCANSLFPHYGQPACWWLARHTDQQKEITAN
jgi:hypothetical protein